MNSLIKKYLLLVVSVIIACICASCESEEDFGFPSKIKMSSKGEKLEIKGENDLPPGITQIQVLDYDGEGNNSGPSVEDKDYLETTTDWLTVKYSDSEYKLVLTAEPNKTDKKRKLYLYLLSGSSRQEITVTQSK